MLYTLKKYKPLTGAVVAAFIALLGFLPQMFQHRSETVGTVTLVTNLLSVFLYAYACWLFNIFLISAENRWLRRTHWVKFLFSFLFGFLASYLFLYALRNFSGAESSLLFKMFPRRKTVIGILLFRGSIVNAFLYFIAYNMFLSAENQRTVIENQRLKHENLEARLHALQQQLSPHFLFNSLSTLVSLTQDEAVQRYSMQLSNIYRYLLTPPEGYMVTLDKEIDFINAYIYIIKERFEEALKISVSIAPELLGRKIPPASLQLLLENAIKHNVVAAETPLEIEIFTQGNYVVVKNTVAALNDVQDGEGIGLYNISERYRLLNGGEVAIEKSAIHFTVKLPLL